MYFCLFAKPFRTRYTVKFRIKLSVLFHFRSTKQLRYKYRIRTPFTLLGVQHEFK